MLQRLFRKEAVLESATVTLVFRILQRIIQTVRGILFARLLAPAEYGVFTLCFFMLPLVGTLGKLGISSCFTRYIPQYEKKGMLRDFLTKTYLMTSLSASIVTVIALCNVRGISQFIFGDAGHRNLVILTMLMVIPHVFCENLRSSFAGLRIFKLSTVLDFTHFLIFTVLGMAMAYFFPVARSAMIAYCISSLTVVPTFALLFYRHISSQAEQTIRIDEAHFYGKILRFSTWFILSPIVDILLRYTDRWMINVFLGLKDVGIYSVAVNVAAILFMLGSISGSVLMPRLSLAWGEGRKDRVISLLNLSIKINTILLLMIGMMISIFKQPLISLLYGSSYLNSLPVIDFLLIGSITMSMCWSVGGYAGLIEKTYIPLVTNSSAFATNVVLNYLLIPRLGITGAAMATVISIAVNFLAMSTWFYKHGFRMRIDTILVCVAPLILFFNPILSGIVLTVSTILIIKTEYILKGSEKSIVRQRFREVLSKYRKTVAVEQ